MGKYAIRIALAFVLLNMVGCSKLPWSKPVVEESAPEFAEPTPEEIVEAAQSLRQMIEEYEAAHYSNFASLEEEYLEAERKADEAIKATTKAEHGDKAIHRALSQKADALIMAKSEVVDRQKELLDVNTSLFDKLKELGVKLHNDPPIDSQ